MVRLKASDSASPSGCKCGGDTAPHQWGQIPLKTLCTNKFLAHLEILISPAKQLSDVGGSVSGLLLARPPIPKGRFLSSGIVQGSWEDPNTLHPGRGRGSEIQCYSGPDMIRLLEYFAVFS